MPLPTRGKPYLNRQEEMSWSSFRRRVTWCAPPPKENKGNTVVIRGQCEVPSGKFDFWVEFDKKSKKIVDYYPK